MEFSNWLRSRSKDDSWVTVADDYVTDNNDMKVSFFMTSVLAKTNSLEKLFANNIQFTQPDFGTTSVWESYGQVQIDERVEEIITNDKDVKVEPFTFYRQWNDTWPKEFGLIQNFILFYNLHFDTTTDKYMAVDESGETKDVIRTNNKTPHKKIEIRTEFLRNYLACKDRILVRQHWNRIDNSRTLDELGIESFCERKLSIPHYTFEISVSEGGLTGESSVSMLSGRDLILPFQKCQHLLGWSKENCKFIIGIDEQGEKIMTSYKKGTNDFLTPVYFKREVLKKYNDSDKYHVDHNCVSNGSYWSIQIDINQADLVQVYLGDIAERLPYNEQLHWKTYNVPPEGGITKRRLTNDFFTSFVDSDDVSYKFHKSLHNFQEKFEKRFSFKPFRPLDKNDAHKDKNIKVPLNDEPEEFEKQILYLSILLQDSINEEQLNYTDIRHSKNNKLGSIKILENFLNRKSLPITIISYLQEIQTLRSSGIAHRKGSKYEKNIGRYGLNDVSGREFIHKLLVDMTKAFNCLAQNIG